MEKEFKEGVEKDINQRNHKLETIVGFIILTIFVLMIGIGSWWYLASQPEVTYNNLRTFGKTDIKESKIRVTEDLDETKQTCKTGYTNKIFNFSLSCESDWILKDNLPKTKNGDFTAAQSLEIISPKGYIFKLFVNPAFGTEGSAIYVRYEKSTINNGSIILGKRVTENGMPGGIGFDISATYLYENISYLAVILGDNISHATEAEIDFNKIIASIKYK